MPRYDVALAALALDVEPAWLDVLLARNSIPGVIRETQGVKRTISDDALVQLAIVRDLHLHLGLAVPKAIPVAADLMQHGHHRVGAVQLQLDLPSLRTQLAAAAADAVERVVPRRRGRPPKTSDGSR